MKFIFKNIHNSNYNYELKKGLNVTYWFIQLFHLLIIIKKFN